MVSPAVGALVLVPFPFSDLSESKLRPALVLADAGKGDWVLCQITSNSYSDPRAVEIRPEHLAQGALRLVSYVRPGKLFTANQTLLVRQAGILTQEAFEQSLEAVVRLLRG